MKSDKAWGYADDSSGVIYLDERMDDRTLIEIAAHETAHIVFPMLDEWAVDLLGKQVADVLTRIGFSRHND